MRRLKLSKQTVRKLVLCLLILGVFLFSFRGLFQTAYGARLGARSLTLSNPTASASSIYNLNFNISTVGTLGSVMIQFCSNGALIQDPCTAPAGFDDSTATIATQTGQTGFSIDGSSTANTLILTRTAATDSLSPTNFVFNGITNPSSPGSYYARVQTYSTTNASGGSSDYGGIAFSIISAVNVSATVPPYLLFCTGISIPGNNCSNATGDFIDFGELNTNRPNQGASQMLAATNAASGYAISVYGTTLESGNNVINAMTSSDVSRPGTGQFGFNLRANSSPSGGVDPSGSGSGSPTNGYNTPNFYKFNSGDIVASFASSDPDRLYTASYIVNIPATQPAGVYITTLTYICIATF